jgi:hypothetical protein
MVQRSHVIASLAVTTTRDSHSPEEKKALVLGAFFFSGIVLIFREMAGAMACFVSFRGDVILLDLRSIS